jgi:nucleotide sugar dehydrogenase
MDENNEQYRVAVVGLGKIGLPLAAQFARAGMVVVGCDISPEVVASVSAGVSHIKEEAGLEERVAEAVRAGRLSATTDTARAVAGCNVVVVIVPVMVDWERRINYGSIDSATRAIAEGLRPGTLVIYETTLPVGSTRTRFGPMLERGSGLRVGSDIHLAFSPERVYSGRIFQDLQRYPKVVGGVTEACSQAAERFYRAALGGADVLTVRNADAAEFVKLAETTYRDVNIALANAFARFADGHDLPVDEVIAAANTQPFSHIHRPGIAVGGHCIPVYPYFLLEGESEGELSLLREARGINDAMSGWTLDRLGRELGGLEGRRVLVLGLAYRENVKETAFSGGVRLIEELRERGAVPLVHDPLYTPEELARWGAEPVSLDALPRVDAAILQAYHDPYRTLDWRSLASAGCRAVLDGRNALDRGVIGAAGMTYIGMGR